MLGLILKDVFATKKQLRVYTVLIAFFVFMGLNDPANNTSDFMVSFFAIMLPMTALAYDERSNWHKYALTMPLSRKDLVLSKYYLGLAYMGIAFVINLLLGFLMISLQGSGVVAGIDVGYLDLFVRNGITALSALLFMSIVMPIFFKFGVETGRIVMMVIALGPTVLILALSKIIPTPPAFLASIGDFILRFESQLGWIGLLVVILAMFISILIALTVFEKKEF